VKSIEVNPFYEYSCEVEVLLVGHNSSGAIASVLHMRSTQHIYSHISKGSVIQKKCDNQNNYHWQKSLFGCKQFRCSYLLLINYDFYDFPGFLLFCLEKER
jgi:hypothetical protein